MSIRLDQLCPFDLVGGPVLIAGIGTGFEAMINYRVHDGHDEVIGPITVGSGTGEHAQFQVKAEVARAAFKLDRAFVEVFELSAKDGSELHKVTRPVLLGSPMVTGRYIGYREHVVKAGDTLSKIAKKHGVTRRAARARQRARDLRCRRPPRRSGRPHLPDRRRRYCPRARRRLPHERVQPWVPARALARLSAAAAWTAAARAFPRRSSPPSPRWRSSPCPPAASRASAACATASRPSATASARCRAAWRGSRASSARPRARSRSSSGASPRCRPTSPPPRRCSPRRCSGATASASARCACASGCSSRAQLAELLRERYAGGEPDIVTVVLEADGFAQPARDRRLPQAHPAPERADPRRRAQRRAATRSCSGAC